MRVPLFRNLFQTPPTIHHRTGVGAPRTRVSAANEGSRIRSIYRLFALAMVVWVPTAWSAPALVSAPKNIVLIAGKKSHGPEGNGIHDYAWSVRLLKVLLDRSNIRDQVRVEMVFDGWPKEEAVIENADATVVLSDGRDGDKYEEAPHFANPGQMQTIRRQVERGCGFGTFHFSTFAPEVYREEILSWSGGYFQWETEGKRRWYSAIKVLDADLSFPNPGHAALRGVQPFRLKEEFYYNLRFNPEDHALEPLLAVPALPGRDPDGRWVAWAKERPDGGRGFGTTCGHFYENWRNDDFRKLMLNVIAWSAHVNVPAQGVESAFVEREEILKALAPVQSQ